MLRLKFIAGLFEQPYADAKHAAAITDNAEARALALEAARKSVVLLKNDGVLPLRADRLKTLAVIGPNAARIDLGGYSNVPTHAVTVLDGIRAKLGDRVRVVSAEGVRLTDSGDWYEDEVVLSDPQRNRERIRRSGAGRARRRRDRARDRRQQRHQPRSLGEESSRRPRRRSA